MNPSFGGGTPMMDFLILGSKLRAPGSKGLIFPQPDTPRCAVSRNSVITPQSAVSPKNKIQKELKKFGNNLRRERKSHNITQEKLAELADLNVRTIQKIEAGQTNILITTAKRIQKALGCSWEKLLN